MLNTLVGIVKVTILWVHRDRNLERNGEPDGMTRQGLDFGNLLMGAIRVLEATVKSEIYTEYLTATNSG